MRRRDFVKAIASSSVAWPLAARAQQSLVIGFLSSGSWNADDVRRLPPFRQGLAETGYAEGQNITIEYRGADNQVDRLPALAADLVGRQVSLIAAGGSPLSALAAKSATATIPIVFANAADPVRLGLIASLNRPGGNVTGVTFSPELEAKHLGLLRELVPTAKSMAILVNPMRPDAESQSAQAQEAARAVGLQLHVLNAIGENDFDEVFRRLGELRANGLMVAPDALFTDHRDQIVALARRHSIPTIYELRDFVVAGGLISYGTGISDMFRQAGILAGRILKGERPADLPVLQPTKFDLVINLKTAQALGLTIPPGILSIADEVIE
jgi:putative ABC transport system substrate-binding protein